MDSSMVTLRNPYSLGMPRTLRRSVQVMSNVYSMNVSIINRPSHDVARAANRTACPSKSLWTAADQIIDSIGVPPQNRKSERREKGLLLERVAMDSQTTEQQY